MEFDIEEFGVLFSSLTSGKYDLITFELGKTDERAENYLFASEPYNTIDVQSGTEFDETVIEAVRNGTFAGFISNKVSINNVNENYGNVYKMVGDPVISQDTYHIFKKGNEELRDKWDGALKELIDDGTINTLKEKWGV